MVPADTEWWEKMVARTANYIYSEFRLLTEKKVHRHVDRPAVHKELIQQLAARTKQSLAATIISTESIRSVLSELIVFGGEPADWDHLEWLATVPGVEELFSNHEDTNKIIKSSFELFCTDRMGRRGKEADYLNQEWVVAKIDSGWISAEKAIAFLEKHTDLPSFENIITTTLIEGIEGYLVNVLCINLGCLALEYLVGRYAFDVNPKEKNARVNTRDPKSDLPWQQTIYDDVKVKFKELRTQQVTHVFISSRYNIISAQLSNLLIRL